MRIVTNLLRRAWYHRPVLTTYARFESDISAATIDGMRWADANPAGKVVTQPRLTLVSR